MSARANGAADGFASGVSLRAQYAAAIRRAQALARRVPASGPPMSTTGYQFNRTHAHHAKQPGRASRYKYTEAVLIAAWARTPPPRTVDKLATVLGEHVVALKHMLFHRRRGARWLTAHLPPPTLP